MGETRFRVKLTQAGRLAGKHKTTILRAIRSGRLSATVGTDGQRRIDVAELERVYGPLHTDARTAAPPDARTPTQPGAPGTAPSADTAALLAELRNRIDRLEADKAELRRDLDAERDERHRLVGIIERAQITDQRPTSTPTPATPRRRRTSSTPPRPTPTPATPMQQIADTVTNWLRGR